MRRALVAALFLVACKDKPADPAAKVAPTPTEQPSKQARPRPALPGGDESAMTNDSERPRLPGADGDRDFGDPARADEMRDRMEERRKRREEMLDTNKDGVVSDAERQQRVEPMRKRLDTNADGKLTPEELGAATGRRVSFDDPAAVDVNKDGEISLSELDTAMTARRDQMRERWRGRGNRGGAAGSTDDTTP